MKNCFIAEIVQGWWNSLALQLAASKTRLPAWSRFMLDLKIDFDYWLHATNDRQSTMQAVIDWSWNVLDTVEKKRANTSTVFRRIWHWCNWADSTSSCRRSEIYWWCTKVPIDKSMLVLRRGAEKESNHHVWKYSSLCWRQMHGKYKKRYTEKTQRVLFSILQENQHLQQSQITEVMEAVSNIQQAGNFFLM